MKIGIASVLANGSLVVGDNVYSCVRNSAGVYDVTFSIEPRGGAASLIVPQATIIANAANVFPKTRIYPIATVVGRRARVRVYCYNEVPSAVDQDFSLRIEVF